MILLMDGSYQLLKELLQKSMDKWTCRTSGDTGYLAYTEDDKQSLTIGWSTYEDFSTDVYTFEFFEELVEVTCKSEGGGCLADYYKDESSDIYEFKDLVKQLKHYLHN